MTLDEFTRTLTAATPPAGARPSLAALWHDARGEWDAAHRVAQDVDDEEGSWVHAYLHRKEGDLGNAAYWYSRAGRSPASGPLDREWAAIVTALLTKP